MTTNNDGNPYAPPHLDELAAPAGHVITTWLPKLLIVVPIVSLGVFVIAILLAVSVGLFDSLPRPWGMWAHRAVDVVGASAPAVGVYSAILCGLIAPRYRTIAIALGAMNAAVFVWVIFH